MKHFFNRGELPQYFVAEDHEPIIDRKTYDAVQAEITRRAALHTDAGKKAADEAEDDVDELMSTMALNDRIHCGICEKNTAGRSPAWVRLMPHRSGSAERIHTVERHTAHPNRFLKRY